LSDILPEAVIRVEPDYAAALAACGDADLCVIAGTGSLICSRSEGKVVKSGGRGYLLGDYGSAFRYGQEFLRYHLDSNRLRYIQKELETTFGSVEEPEVISNLYRAGPPAPKLARFAESFAEACGRQEPFALDFLKFETDRLAAIVTYHVQQFHPEKSNIRMFLSGGLWKVSPIFREALQQRLMGSQITYQLDILRRPPVEGAVILATEAAQR
jgi:N-acetylglucosamine kinase-like BadF-type ATPase